MGDCKEKESRATRKSILLETKMQVLRQLDAGEEQADIGTALNLSTSTICTILKITDKIISQQLQPQLLLQQKLPVSEAM